LLFGLERGLILGQPFGSFCALGLGGDSGQDTDDKMVCDQLARGVGCGIERGVFGLDLDQDRDDRGNFGQAKQFDERRQQFVRDSIIRRRHLVVDCQQIVQSFVQELTKLWTLFNQKEERKKK